MPYTIATPADLKQRYPEFAAVPDQRVAYWIADAGNAFDIEPLGKNQVTAQALYAAHQLAMEGDGEADGDGVPVGVTSMRSGSLSLSFDAGYVASRAEGGWGATKYGAQLYSLLKSYLSGPRVTGGVVSSIGWCQDVYGRSPRSGWLG